MLSHGIILVSFPDEISLGTYLGAAWEGCPFAIEDNGDNIVFLCILSQPEGLKGGVCMYGLKQEHTQIRGAKERPTPLCKLEQRCTKV